MPYAPFRFPLTGGQDRRVSTLLAEKDSFYSLVNMRQSLTRGVLESTPRFKLHRQFNQGTYNTGSGNLTEDAGAQVHFFEKSSGYELYMSDHSLFKCVGTTQTQLKCFKQITCPTGNSIYKGCLLTLDSVSSISITLGQTYDVEIDGVNTFRWRVNGGAWTAGVVIDQVNGNVIDTGARLFWLASTGFTLTDTWSWRRTDDTDLFGSGFGNLRFVRVNSNYYYISASSRVYSIRFVSGSDFYIVTAGYQPLFARNINVFQNHLMLIDCDPEVTTTYTLGSIANSDIDNYDCFIATDVNEADWTHLALITTSVVPWAAISNLSITSMVLQNRLFIFTANGIFYTDYAGLPVPFNYQYLGALPLASTSLGYAVVTPQGAFLAFDNGFYGFDGTTVTPIIADLAPNILGVAGSPVIIDGIFYDSTRMEVIIQTSSSWIVYQTLYGTFYTRRVSFNANYATSGRQSALLQLYFSNNAIFVPVASRSIFIEDINYNGTPILDDVSGTIFAVPTLTTQMVGVPLSIVKDNAPVYVAFKSSSAGAGYRSYTTQMAKIEWYTSDIGEIASLATGSGQVVMNNYRQISIRISYRSVAFTITFPATTTTTLPAPACTLHAIETEIYVPAANR